MRISAITPENHHTVSIDDRKGWGGNNNCVDDIDNEGFAGEFVLRYWWISWLKLKVARMHVYTSVCFHSSLVHVLPNQKSVWAFKMLIVYNRH